jgi:hypothetical protein
MMDINQTNLEEAGFLLDKALGTLHEFEDYHDFRLHNSPVKHLSADEVTGAISAYILGNLHSSDELLPLAIYTLSKSKDKQYAKLYLLVMEKSQNTNTAACFYSAVAYENLGFQVFLNRGNLDNDTDILQAINGYLAKHKL